MEDAAHALLASYQDRPLGTLGALSFHATKNVVSGEGGVILVNDRKLIARAEILRDKGTNRSASRAAKCPRMNGRQRRRPPLALSVHYLR